MKTNGDGRLVLFLVNLLPTLIGPLLDLKIILEDIVLKLTTVHFKGDGRTSLVNLQIFSYVKEIQQNLFQLHFEYLKLLILH